MMLYRERGKHRNILIFSSLMARFEALATTGATDACSFRKLLRSGTAVGLSQSAFANLKFRDTGRHLSSTEYRHPRTSIGSNFAFLRPKGSKRPTCFFVV